MIHRSKHIGFSIALLIAGSAISLISCGTPAKPSETSDEKIISRTVRDMEVLSSDNGLRRRLMRAPLMEEHAFAKPAFEEFREGMEVIGYDSLGLNPSSRVIADHALHWKERDVWQLSGNVVVEGEEGQKLYTQQFFWDVKTKKIWSNVDSKLEENDGVLYVTSFVAMDDFSRFEGRNGDGTMKVDVEPVATLPAADSVATIQALPPVTDSVAVVPPAPPVDSGADDADEPVLPDWSSEPVPADPAPVADSLPVQP